MKRFKLSSSPRTGVNLFDCEHLLEMDRPADPDFSIKDLSDYSTDDLLLLGLAVSIAFEQGKKTFDATTMRKLDIWGYRIKDAMKEAAKREGIEQDLDYTEILRKAGI